MAFFLNVNLLALPILLVSAFVIGSLPDIDNRIGIRHRGFTHGLLFFLFGALGMTFFVFYFHVLLQWLIGIPLFEVTVTYIEWFPVPSFIMSLLSGDITSVIADQFFKYLAFFFVSLLSHLVLDIMTPVGINLGGYNVNGSIKSNNTAFNFIFAGIGFVNTIVSIAFMVMRFLGLLAISWFTWFFIVDAALILCIILTAIFWKKSNNMVDLKCFHVDAGLNVCVPRGKCFQLSDDKDDRVCNID
jgi:membrane-bound metal-dependent hydrolase YbcI (DUF457 family)